MRQDYWTFFNEIDMVRRFQEKQKTKNALGPFQGISLILYGHRRNNPDCPVSVRFLCLATIPNNQQKCGLKKQVYPPCKSVVLAESSQRPSKPLLGSRGYESPVWLGVSLPVEAAFYYVDQ